MSTPATDLRARLEALATNFAFSWRPDVRRLFERLDPEGWQRAEGAPAALLASLGGDALERAAADGAFTADVAAAARALEDELGAPSWWDRAGAGEGDFLVAYFSAEFGVDTSLPIYSGGLGVLAGDHLKAAHELGLPLVAVGLFYTRGYFRQELDENGRQAERYVATSPRAAGLVPALDAAGEPLRVTVNLAGDALQLAVWEARVGRVRLLLLDSNLPENSDAGRDVTCLLYGGDRDLRIRQELALGVGGARALEALGLTPTVWHLNEGHSAFLAVERLRLMVVDGVPYEEALGRVRASTVFTTHTPVPAGNEVFDPELVRRYVGSTLADLGMPWERFVELGQAEGHYGFGMTPLALRISSHANGVSRLHGEVSRGMWASLWPGRPVDEVPISSVTNAVHARTWLAPEVAELLRGAGVRPEGAPDEQSWERAEGLDPEALWRAHESCRRALLELAARRVAPGERPALNPDALTIAFARRFATYKRAGLLLSDPERLARLAGAEGRPVQFLFAGKAHPADEGGKDVMQQVVAAAREAGVAGRLVFLPDYEMTLARALVQGVDVWLNNPRRPLEASGTSGMKAGMNGALNVSILDGWWAEACTAEIGWAIGRGDGEGDEAAQDARDAEELFRVLEEEVVPAFYDRGADGVPERWARMMRSSIAQVGGTFNASRMVVDYVESFYLPAHRAARQPA